MVYLRKRLTQKEDGPELSQGQACYEQICSIDIHKFNLVCTCMYDMVGNQPPTDPNSALQHSTMFCRPCRIRSRDKFASRQGEAMSIWAGRMFLERLFQDGAIVSLDNK